MIIKNILGAVRISPGETIAVLSSGSGEVHRTETGAGVVVAVPRAGASRGRAVPDPLRHQCPKVALTATNDLGPVLVVDYRVPAHIGEYILSGDIYLPVRPPAINLYIRRIGNYALKQPVLMRMRYDRSDRLWCLENDEMALSGYGSTFRSALESLEDSVDTLITGIRAFDDSRLSEDSKRIKRCFEKYVDWRGA